MSKEQQPYETSALRNILNAGATGIASPSAAAQIAAAASRHVPPGAESATAQGLQAMVNMTVEGTKELMSAAVRQQGKSPSAVLQDLIIRQSIAAKTPITPKNQSTVNKGIETARQKTAAKPSESGKGKSANKGIESYQSKKGGQSVSSSKRDTGTVEVKVPNRLKTVNQER